VWFQAPVLNDQAVIEIIDPGSGDITGIVTVPAVELNAI
jgi:hypothetical protein